MSAEAVLALARAVGGVGPGVDMEVLIEAERVAGELMRILMEAADVAGNSGDAARDAMFDRWAGMFSEIAGELGDMAVGGGNGHA